MAEVATKSTPPPKTSHELGLPRARLADMVDRTAQLSRDVMESLETNGRATIEAVGSFVITIEEALPREVTSTSEVVRSVTESGLEMFDRLVHTEYDFLRGVVDGVAKSASAHNGVKPAA